MSNNGEKLEYYGRGRASRGEALEVFARTSMNLKRVGAAEAEPPMVAGEAAPLEAAALEFRCVHCGRDTREDCYCF
jgi:hypothetical protein